MRCDPHQTARRAPLAISFIFAASLCATAQAVGRANDEPETAQPNATERAHPTPTATPPPQPRATPLPHASPSLEREFVRNVLRDQRAIWTSPFHLGRTDARWLVPLGLSTAALIATDRYTAGAIDDDDHLAISRRFSGIGSAYGAGGIAAAFYLAGRASHSARARETGILGGEAIVDGLLVSVALKSASQRPRPFKDDASGEFFDGGKSFPSGHAISAWSLAAIVAEEYHARRAVRFGAYGLATAVSLARYTGRNHFLSDALVGSAIGYGVGRYVYHAHHDRALDAGGEEVREESRLLPRIAPAYDPRTRLYGVALAWSF